jgi:hypothetical protein
MKTENSFDFSIENIHRQTFHLFCDDICEEILVFLSINDKLRLECVSKMFN